MKVTLVSYTPDAAALLIFTKSTRLQIRAGYLEEIKTWSPDRILAELLYMSDTIPSSWEFVDYVFSVEGVSRAYTHQQVRTRAGSYAQQTMRVLEMGEFDYIMTDANKRDPRAVNIIERHKKATQDAYSELLEIGQAAEDARGVLPTNIGTNIICKFNLRTMSELARSRTGGRTQGEYRAVVNAMVDAILEVHPWAQLFLFPRGRGLFDDMEAFAESLNPEQRVKLLKIADRLRKEMA